jgi:hypothetical protein
MRCKTRERKVNKKSLWICLKLKKKIRKDQKDIPNERK